MANTARERLLAEIATTPSQVAQEMALLALERLHGDDIARRDPLWPETRAVIEAAAQYNAVMGAIAAWAARAEEVTK